MDAKIHPKQAVEDADILIITTALEMAPSNEHVTVVGEDIDLLVILIGLCSPDIQKSIFFEARERKSFAKPLQPSSGC